jgi:hypothetical protein
MCGTVLCVAVVALGIDVGWQPLPEGGMEYVVQLEPQTVDLLRSGVEIPSDIPASLKDLRRLRITVGNATLVRKMPPEAVAGPTFPAVPGSPLVRMTPQQRASHLFLDTLFPPYHPVKVRPPEVRPEARAEVRPKAGAARLLDEMHRKPADAAPLAERSPVTWSLTLGALIGAAAAAVFLAWIAWEYRIRYRRLLAQLQPDLLSRPGQPG